MTCVLMILNCIRYAHRREAQKEWLKDIIIPYYHIIGNPTLETEYSVDQENKIIYVKCEDTYEALFKKTYLGVKTLLNLYPDIQYIYKTDDDTKCNVENFYRLPNIIQGYDYAGQIIKTDTHYSTYHYPYVDDKYKYPLLVENPEFCAGFFYVLSRKAINILLENKYIFNYEIAFEDYEIGKIMHNNKLNVLNFDAKSILTPDNA